MLARLFGSMAAFAKHLRQSRENDTADEAAAKAGYIACTNNQVANQPYSYGGLIITRVTGENALADPHVRVEHQGRRVLDHASYGDHHCILVSKREFNPDFKSWVPELDRTYRAELSKHRPRPKSECT